MTTSIFARNLPRQSIQVSLAKEIPHIDGLLNDSVWQQATFFSAFSQQTPTPFETPSVKTEIAAAYSADTLYVAVRCHGDSAEVISRFVRRDRDGDFDKVELILSPMNDGVTAFGFIVNPDGMMQDGLWSDDTVFDRNWDATWEVATRRAPGYWSAEFAIPWDQLRFSGQLTEMGFQVKRWQASRHELLVFNPRPRGAKGEVSRLGRLTGFPKLSPRLPFSMKPELVLNYLHKDDASEQTSPEGGFFGVGGYVKAGVASGWTLDLALKPDFGEVEQDAAQINLSSIETVYAEKRPFFLENRQMFETPISLFYSRRLGAKPPKPDVDDNETVVEVPLNTPIVMASKLSGTSANGNYMGLMHVLSAPTRVWVKNDDTERKRREDATFWTHDSVLRIGKQFKNGSDIGLLATGHIPLNHANAAFAGGGDWNLFWKKKEYVFKGQIACSSVQDEDADNFDTGMGVMTRIGRQSGDYFRPYLQYEYRSVDFDINALGYLDRNDIHKLTASFDVLLTEKRKLIYEFYTGMQFYQNWNTDGLNLTRSMTLYGNIKWRNRMWTYFGASAKLSHYDDVEFSDGPPLKRIPGILGWATLTTPAEKPVGASVEWNTGTDDTGYYFIFKPALLVRWGRLELELNYRLVRAKDRESYADKFTKDDEKIYIVSKRNLLESDIGLKTTVALAQNISWELNTQLLASRAHYHDFRRLLPDSREVATNYSDNPDFGKTIWRLQTLLRYEFLPQSVLYFMYSRQSNGELDAAPYSIKRTWQTFNQSTEQRFLIKAGYLF
ncbi:MAG: carbohydrate binding family 9 domain-containing protein [Deltaproteobacteria bacterium]|nr:carbohydrate binding family 9 domain-containing protein [Deltaproteobacteria bacterium]